MPETTRRSLTGQPLGAAAGVEGGGLVVAGGGGSDADG
jgi:hypothetical protein